MFRSPNTLPFLATAVLGLLAPVSLAGPAHATSALEPQSGTPEELARLVPMDAFAFSQMSSLDDLDAVVTTLVEAFDPSLVAMVDIDQIVAQGMRGAVDMSQLDRTKPIGAAVSFGKGQLEPVATFIFPVKDTKAYLASAITVPGMAAPLTLGNYVGVSLQSDYVIGTAPNPFAANMPAGQFAVRFDLERLVKTLGPMIDMGLMQVEGQFEQMAAQAEQGGAPDMDMAPFLDAYLQWLRVFVDSAETLELGLSVQGTTLELAGAFTAQGGSPLDGYSSKEKTSLRELARFIDPNAAMSTAMGANMAELLEHVQPMMDELMSVYSPNARLGFKSYSEQFAQLFPLMGKGLVSNGEFDAAGLRFSYYFRPDDQQAVIDQYSALVGSPDMEAFGIRLSGPETNKVAGAKVTEFRFELLSSEKTAGLGGDEISTELFHALYGQDTRLRFVTVEDVMALVFGGDDAYLQAAAENLKRGGTPLSLPLRNAVKAVGEANPAYIASFDVARVMGQMQSLTSEMLGEEFDLDLSQLAGVRAPVLAYGAIRERTWHGGIAFDLVQFMDFFKLLEDL